MTTPTPKPRWFRFRLRTLVLFLFLLLIIAWAWFAARAVRERREKAIAASFDELADIYFLEPAHPFDCQPRVSGLKIYSFTWFADFDAKVTRLSKQLGEYPPVSSMSFENTQGVDEILANLKTMPQVDVFTFTMSDMSDEGLTRLAELTNPKTLFLNWCYAAPNASVTITDDGLIHLRRMTRLKHLYLDSGQFTDDGLVHLAALVQLETLSLGDNCITDSGLVHLEGLSNLRELSLYNCTNVTVEGIRKLQEALPHCDITHGGYSVFE